ncbi:MAG TPA: NAD-dependent epimerase/dehydratase family protein [Ktedonobacterales bacterium]|nr:NAD-dependent epimerase/dehydratase family protein [Ktedonobacterales bacterium]
MRILVIGGTNFIGPHVVRRLAQQGHELTLFHRGPLVADAPKGRFARGAEHPDLPEGVEQISGDRERLAKYADMLRSVSPEVVLDMIPENDDNARAVQDVFRGVARRVVAISSQDVYRAYGRLLRAEPGLPDPVPLTEDAPLRERMYVLAGRFEGAERYEKILAERVYLSDATLPGTVLRLPAVYGPGDHQHRVFEYLKRMDDGRKVIVLEESLAGWRWTRGYVDNVADAVALAIADDRAAGRVYNVGEPDTLTQAEWVRAIGAAADWQGEVVVMPTEQLPEGMRFDGDSAQSFWTDSSRIRRELGYAERIPRDEALRRTVTWERAHPPTTFDAAQYDYAAEDAALAP